jgi:4-hydroxybenzoate polyprenyltransferase
MFCYCAALAVLACVGAFHGMGAIYYAGLAAAAAFVGYHYRLIRGRDREACFRAFNQNNWVGAVIFAGMFADFAVRRGIPWM